jgi:Glycosyltransferase sugar-binding region containing DXD motif
MPVMFYWSGQNFDFGNYLSIASAATHLADGDEAVVFVDEKPHDNRHFARLDRLPRTSVEPLVRRELMSAEHGALYDRMRYVAHRADLVRFAVLAKYGGLYLDTDTLTRKSLASIPPRLLLDDGKIVHVGIMALPRSDELAERMLTSLLDISESDLSVYQSIVYRWTAIVRQAGDTVHFGALEAYFPVHWKQWETIFRPGEFTGDVESIHILHHYGYLSSAYTSSMDEDWIAAHPCLFSEAAGPVLASLAALGAPGIG